MASNKRHQMLSSSHRTAVTIDLTFKFRFYGHNITNVTVATGGFIYASPFLHQWLTATQYIAPLMANFDTTLGNHSDVYYNDFGNRFIVEWSNVHLKDQEPSGPFSFQVHLYVGGVIKFLYKQLPISIANISSSNHPVKVGVSDAYYIDTTLREQGVRRRTIYEYHRVSIGPEKIRQGTVVTLNPLPTCNILSDCGSCVSHESMDFDCKWCSAVDRCSDGMDWHRQEWISRGCTDDGLSTRQSCASLLSTSTPSAATNSTPVLGSTAVSSTSTPSGGDKVSTSSSLASSALPSSPGLHTSTVATPHAPVASTPKHPVSPLATTQAQPTSGVMTTTSAQSGHRTPGGSARPSGTTLGTGSLPPTSETGGQGGTGVPGAESSSRPAGPPSPGTVVAPAAGSLDSSSCMSIDGAPCPSHAFPIGGVVAIILVVLAVLFAIGGWVLYAYNNPQSASGMWLMEHRPSQMKDRIAKIKFWKSSTPSGTKYRVESEA